MLKYIIYTISLILALMATVIFVLCVLLLEAVVLIAAKSVNLFKGKNSTNKTEIKHQNSKNQEHIIECN